MIDKPNFLYLPGWVSEAEARIFTHGAEKHEPRGWLTDKHDTEDFLNKALRHLNRMQQGELYDPDTGEFHGINARADIAMYLDRLVKIHNLDERKHG